MHQSFRVLTTVRQKAGSQVSMDMICIYIYKQYAMEGSSSNIPTSPPKKKQLKNLRNMEVLYK